MEIFFVSILLLLTMMIQASLAQTSTCTAAADRSCTGVNPGYLVGDDHVTLSVGCYYSRGSHRVFPAVSLVNFRGIIDWQLWEAAGSAEQVIVECAKVAIGRGDASFGLEFYGECYTGDAPDLSQGEVTDTAAQRCNRLCAYDVGAANAVFVYNVYGWYRE